MGSRIGCAGKIVLLFLLLGCAKTALAQRFTLSTNLLEYANLGTLNLDASFGVAQKWSVVAGVRYNPFSFSSRDRGRFYNRQHSWSAGAKYWLWHINTGWWFGSKLRYQEYSSGGLFKPTSEEGDRYGMGFYAGYSYMLHPHLNLEFGAGLWTGGAVYRVFSCPTCGRTLDEGSRMFVLPDDLMISLVYVF
ncbi:MAG: DUF3575 domain-containing protein [Candidatus Cryptobacteroides sp.]